MLCLTFKIPSDKILETFKELIVVFVETRFVLVIFVKLGLNDRLEILVSILESFVATLVVPTIKFDIVEFVLLKLVIVEKLRLAILVSILESFVATLVVPTIKFDIVEFVLLKLVIVEKLRLAILVSILESFVATLVVPTIKFDSFLILNLVL